MAEPTPPPPLPSPDDVSSDAPSGFGSGWTERRTLEIEEDTLIGTVLNDTYRIGRIIGEGGMGRVYEAWHTRISKKRYAIKVLHAEFARNEGILKRFQREAETAASLSHPNAVGVYDVGVTSDARPFLVSEYLEGSDLAHRIKQAAPLPPDFVRFIGLQIAGALIEAHSKGVVHRDLKPQNIFLLAGPDGEISEQPIAKVLDFGLSRFLDDADSELTRSGMVMGTPSYMSPEQARGERADHRVDVYGLGAILYACVAGRPPFKSSSPQATVLAVMNEEAPRPSKLNAEVPPQLEFVIQKAMAREPNRRYATMAALHRDIDALAFDANVKNPGTGKREQPLPLGLSPRLGLVAVWVFSALLFCTAAAAALWGAVFLRYGYWPLSRAASGLLGFVVAAAFAVPLLSLARTLRARIWGNTARVVEILDSTRRVSLTAVSAYAATAGLLLLLNVLVPFFPRLVFLQSTVLGTFAGVALVAFGAFASCALAMGWREYLLSPGGWVDRAATAEQGWRRRFVVGPLFIVVVLSLLSSTVVAARHWHPVGHLVGAFDVGRLPDEHAKSAVLQRGAGEGVGVPPLVGSALGDAGANLGEALRGGDGAQGAKPASVGLSQSAGAPEGAGLSGNTGSESGPSSLGTPPTDTDRVPDGARFPERALPNPVGHGALGDEDAVPDEGTLAEASHHSLTAAISQGGEALEQLAEQFPNDPRVLRAVAMDHASRASGLEKAVDAFERLFAVSPQSVYDGDLQQIILAVARSRGTAMHKAFELMGYHMGHVGPDLLYKLSLSDRERRIEARAYLGRPKVRQSFSPALEIAYDLQFAASCASRVVMLPRAAQFGDERSLVILATLAAEPKTGCGKHKQQPCRAKCPQEAAQFEQTVRAIADRLRAAPSASNPSL